MLGKINLRLPIFIALIASTTLSFELLQTRILSALYFNNVVYMTVTIALLGFGIAGVLISILQHKISKPDTIAGYCAAGMALSILLCIHAVSAMPSTLFGLASLYKMILSYFLLVIPFFFAGSALSLIFICQSKNIFELYFVDLCASAIAAIFFSLLLEPLGGANFVWLCAIAPLVAFLLLLPATKKEISWIIALFMIAYLIIGQNIINNQPEAYKATARFFNQQFGAKLEASSWSNIAKIDVYSDQLRNLQTSEYLKKPASFMFLGQDNDAPTMMHGEADLNNLKKMALQKQPTEVSTLAYFIKPQAKDTLVIGVGGGIDVIEARAFGAKNIDGAEINAATIHLVTQQFRDYVKWPSWPNIHIYHSEGRHFTKSVKKKYDVIIMHGVDTFAALNSGAYVLSENYLYTVEAMQDYLAILKSHGVIVIYRWFFLQPRESLRLANLFMNAAPMVGEGPADQRIMVIKNGSWAGTFIKREPFTVAEIELVAQLVNQAGYEWIYIPKIFGRQQNTFETAQFQMKHDELAIARAAYQHLFTAPNSSTREQFIRTYPYNISAVYDDSPFFFEYYKGKVKNIINENWASREDGSLVDWNNLRGPVVHYVLYILLTLTTIACLLSMGIPLIIFERQGIHFPRASRLIIFFCSLAVGFMFIEIGSMQWLNLYLGNPMYSLIVVLGSLLFFAGIGSLLASRWSASIHSKLKLSMLSIALLVPIWLTAMKWITSLTDHCADGIRILVVVLSIVPLGICMGIPFASGLRYLADYQPRFLSWAWGVNGVTSVTASILAIILAMKFGFTLIILSTSFIYIIGYVAFRDYLKQ